jgi:hypothetical protein
MHVTCKYDQCRVSPNLLSYSVTSQVPNQKGSPELEGGYRHNGLPGVWTWSNGGMIISRGKAVSYAHVFVLLLSSVMSSEEAK